jgi:hypothetical protein
LSYIYRVCEKRKIRGCLPTFYLSILDKAGLLLCLSTFTLLTKMESNFPHLSGNLEEIWCGEVF